MISTDKKSNSTQILIYKQSNPSTKIKLEARWQIVKGKLVRRWVEV